MTDVYTVRMGIIDVRLWNQHDLVELYKSELSKAGFKSPQYPSVSYPLTKVRMEKGQPFPEARTIHISVPVFGDFDQTRDMRVTEDKDPAQLAQVGKALMSVFTWNLCAPATDKDPSGTLRNIFRSVKPAVGILKLSPKVAKYLDAPLEMEGYPAKQPEPTCKVDTAPAKFRSKSGLWALLIGIGMSIVSKGKV